MLHRPNTIAVLAIFGIALGGCVDPSRTEPSGREAALSAAHEAERHDEKRFLVDYGGTLYRVNAQYVGMIGRSVVAVRQGADDAVAEGWPGFAVEPRGPAPAGLPFEAEAFEAVATEIAEAVRTRGEVCPLGTEMHLDAVEDGLSTIFRAERQAWAVFAHCAPTRG